LNTHPDNAVSCSTAKKRIGSGGAIKTKIEILSAMQIFGRLKKDGAVSHTAPCRT
jgi:hypothetical protein